MKLAIWLQTAKQTSDVSTVEELVTCRETAIRGKTVKFVVVFVHTNFVRVSELCNKTPSLPNKKYPYYPFKCCLGTIILYFELATFTVACSKK